MKPSQDVCSVCSLTWGQADAVSILKFKAWAFEFAFPLLHVGLVFVELENEDVELSLQHVDLPLCQLLLPTLQQLLLRLLLEGSPRQLLFSGTQLLEEPGIEIHIWLNRQTAVVIISWVHWHIHRAREKTHFFCSSMMGVSREREIFVRYFVTSDRPSSAPVRPVSGYSWQTGSVNKTQGSTMTPLRNLFS